MKNLLFAGLIGGIVGILFGQQDFSGGGQGSPHSFQGGGNRMQPMMMGGNESTAMAVADGAIFIVSRGRLLKFDDKTLKNLASTNLNTDRDSNLQGGPVGSDQNGPVGNPPNGDFSGGQNENGPGGMGSGSSGMKGMPPRGGGGVAICVANGMVYVISQGKLYKFDDKDLKLQGSAEIEPRKNKNGK